MKKILLYTDTHLVGGAELQMFLLAKFLNKENFTPVLAASRHSNLNNWCQKFENEGIKVIRLQVSHKHDPRHYFQIRKIIKNEQIDIMHAHIWNPASCRFALMAAKIPIITTEHDPFQLNFIKDALKKSTLKHINKIVTVSKQNAHILKNLYPAQANKIKIIHNGIDTDWWQSQLLGFSQKDRKNIKTELFQAKEDTFVLISIATLHERKGLNYLIEAMPQVVARYPNVKLIIIGEGPDHTRLQHQIDQQGMRAHVSLLGRRSNIPKLLKSSNIFILPSRREAFGLVNLEAMITGLPVVATRVGGIPEIIEDEISGLLVEPENPKALELAIKKLIADPDLRTKIAKGGKEKVLQEFSAKKMAEEYEKIYLEV